MLRLLEAFDEVCRAHGLSYWLDFGTLLGARRHGGFIPWDDDLDVTMPLDDYRRFLKIAQRELPSSIFVQHKKSDPEVPNHYIKLRDRASWLVEEGEDRKEVRYHQGIFLDIFPANIVRSKHLFLYRSLLYMTKLFSNRYIHIDAPARAGIALLNRFHDPEKGDIVVAGGESLHWFEPYSTTAIFPLKKMRFETGTYPVPADTDRVLRHIFGPQYMQLPPMKKRKSHSVRIEPKRPCPKEEAWKNASPSS